jgi:hypothetical protein
LHLATARHGSTKVNGPAAFPHFPLDTCGSSPLGLIGPAAAAACRNSGRVKLQGIGGIGK